MTIEIEWDDLMTRFKAHKERLGLTNKEINKYLKEKYGCSFYRLTDGQLMELGMTFKQCQTKDDFLELIPF